MRSNIHAYEALITPSVTARFARRSSSPQRKQGVGIEIWDRSTPYYGAVDDEMPHYDIREHHALARQHRFFVKDQFDSYVFFSCWVSVVTLKYFKQHMNFILFL